MNDVLNKPRVFLSHSKKDIEFIETLYNDLVKCQIQPWMDEIDIQHGESWLDAIFEGGIAACDCILVYLTDRSIESDMVKKEIDASIIQKLTGKQVGILLYVSSTSVRDMLRPDLQTLHCPVWSTDNYQELLPRVVAEIWRYFLRRTVNMAINDEKTKRLEAELQLKEMTNRQGDSIFSNAEENGFSFIIKHISTDEMIEFSLIDNSTDPIKVLQTYSVLVNMQTLVPLFGGKGNFQFSENTIRGLIKSHIKSHIQCNEQKDKKIRLELTRCPDFVEEMLMYGFIERKDNPRKPPSEKRRGGAWLKIYPPHIYIITPKWDRFRFWLACNNLLSKEVGWRHVDKKEG
jgi:TIR domain